MERAVCIIPARMASERFPGKVLADRTGWPMIRHVWERARTASSVSRLVIATDDARVAAACASFGGECVMTRPDHPNGTSRLGEAAEILGLPDDAVIVNVQGDEPEIEPGVIDACVGAMAVRSRPMATVATPVADRAEVLNPNIVKVVVREDGAAMYFSRAPIPFDRSGAGAGEWLRHVGIYAYRRGFLRTYLGLAETACERVEKLEQLRVLAHGHEIGVVVWEGGIGEGLDTPEQYERFVTRWNAGA